MKSETKSLKVERKFVLSEPIAKLIFGLFRINLLQLITLKIFEKKSKLKIVEVTSL